MRGTLTQTFVAILASLRPFGQHLVIADGCHLGADRAGLDQSQISRHDLEEVAARLGDQGGVGGDTVDEAALGQVRDLGHVRRVDEELHAWALLASCGADQP